MPGMALYLVFLASLTVALVVPGPDTLVVLRTTFAGGTRPGVRAAAGAATGFTLWGAAALAGLAALLATSPVLFTAVRLAGAAYLALLGVRSLTAPPAEVVAGGGGRAFRTGLLSDLANV